MLRFATLAAPYMGFFILNFKEDFQMKDQKNVMQRVHERRDCIQEWEALADEEYNRYTVSHSGLMAFNFFVKHLEWEQVMQSMSSAYEKFPDNKDIEKRFECLWDLNIYKIKIQEGVIGPFHIDGDV